MSEWLGASCDVHLCERIQTESPSSPLAEVPRKKLYRLELIQCDPLAVFEGSIDWEPPS